MAKYNLFYHMYFCYLKSCFLFILREMILQSINDLIWDFRAQPGASFTRLQIEPEFIQKLQNFFAG